MKGKWKKIGAFVLFAFAMLAVPTPMVHAIEMIDQGDIKYAIDTENNTAVVSRGADTIVNAVILEEVIYEGKAYPVVAIGEVAFMQCYQMKTVSIPDSVTSIGMSAFMFCTSLEEILIPDSVTSIGYCAFYHCDKLKHAIIPDSVVFTMEDQAIFGECEGLESITLPSNLKIIPPGLCFSCPNLKSVTIPSGVTEIGFRSFSECQSLESITIPEGVTKVDYSAFEGCANLKEIYYPVALKGQLEETAIPKTATQIGYKVNDNGTLSLEVLYIPEGITEIVIPETIDGKNVTSISGLENSNIKIKCNKHAVSEWGKDTAYHWITNCSVCGKVDNSDKEKHSYGDGTKACVCGYVPFTLKMEEKNITAMYGEEKMITFDVTATATLGTEKIMYEWFEDGKSIIKSNVASFGVPIGKEVGTYTYYCKVSCGAYSVQSADVKVTITVPKKGKVFCHTRSGGKYKIVKNSKKKKEVTYVKPMNAKKTETIPDTIKVGGATYKVTGIAAKAFQKNRKITKVTIGTNVTSIGAKAFYKCTKLKSIHIKSKKLTTKKVGSKAFANTHKKVTVKVPKKKLNTYKKMLKTKGISTKAKYKKL